MADREWKGWPFAPPGTPPGTMAYVTDTGQFAPVDGTQVPGTVPTTQPDGVTVAWQLSTSIDPFLTLDGHPFYDLDGNAFTTLPG